jgi:hypothetical protein
MISTFFGEVTEISDKTICKLEIAQKSIFAGLHWALSC